MFTNVTVTWAPGMSLENLEREVVAKAYRFYNQDKTATAASLGICVRTMTNKLDKLREDQEGVKQASEKRGTERKAQLARCRGQSPEQLAHLTPQAPTPIVEAAIESPSPPEQVTNLALKKGR